MALDILLITWRPTSIILRPSRLIRCVRLRSATCTWTGWGFSARVNWRYRDGYVGEVSGFGGQRWLTEGWLSSWKPVGWGFGHLNLSGSWLAGAPPERFHYYGATVGWVGRRGAEKHPWITRVFAEYAGGENLTGDQALLQLDRALRTQMRKENTYGRWADACLAAVLPGTPYRGAAVFTNRVRSDAGVPPAG